MPRPEKFMQPLRVMRERIAQGGYAPGSLFPSEADLCQEFGLSRSCIRRTLAGLRQEGLIVAEQGRGHFVVGHSKAGVGGGQDTVLVMPVQLAQMGNSDSENWFYMLFTLIEQHVLQQGHRLHHVQLLETQHSADVMRQVEAFNAPWVVLAGQVHDEWGGDALLWYLLHGPGRRVVVSAFTEQAVTPLFDQVGVDWAMGTRQAVDYLARRGHRRILYAGLDGIAWSDLRQASFLAAMRQAGLWAFDEPPPVVPYSVSERNVSGYAPTPADYAGAAANLCERLASQGADAVICVNDKLIEHLLALKPAGNLPEWVGYDNSAWAREHGITSVSMDLRRHVDRLLEMLAAPPAEHARIVKIPTLLAIR